ncbi:MAG: T9SS type A sorting domain-containing protein [Bacteroidales bacterium]|nr:T9SS type A sorting domain-containing protein [Bacteroidales bacterium]
MKKIIIILLLVVSCDALFAQTPNTRDTIMGREPTYYYQYWFDSAHFQYARSCRKQIGAIGRTEVAKYNYTDSALTIVGIAAYVFADTHVIGLPWDPQCADTSLDNWYENFILYKPTDTGMVPLATQRYSILDTTRWMRLYYNIDYYLSNSDSVYVGYFPIYEAYFDEPVSVTDSFYVATTNYHGVVDSQSWTYPGLRAGTSCYLHWESQKPCYLQHIAWKDFNITNNQWRYEEADVVLLVFPIIDTTQPRCWRHVGLNVRTQDSNGVYLAWESGENNRTWEVAYGRADEDPEGYSTLFTHTPECVLTGLTAGAEYAVRVRASCFNNTQYSSWTDTLRFTREGEPLSIVTIDDDGDGIRLMPNPARGLVTVLSSYRLSGVVVYDLAGRAVLEQEEEGLSTTFDVSALAKGVYVVAIHTPAGIATKRLVVERN